MASAFTSTTPFELVRAPLSEPCSFAAAFGRDGYLRRLVAGEQYSVGDEVESFEHMPTWYPATILKYNPNGSYVLRFDNGELADAADVAEVRAAVSEGE